MDRTDHGEESGAATLVLDEPAGSPDIGVRVIGMRVDGVVALLALLGPAAPPAGAMPELADTQATCLDDGMCLDLVPVSTRLVPED